MEPYTTQLNNLESQGVFLVTQFTRNILEDALTIDEDEGRDAIGSISARCSDALEIINPSLEKDIDWLKRIREICKNWYEAVID